MPDHRYIAISPLTTDDPPFGNSGATYSGSYSDVNSALTSELGDLTSTGLYGTATVLHIECLGGNSETSSILFDGWKTDKAVDGSYVEIRSYFPKNQWRIIRDAPNSITEPTKYMYNIDSNTGDETLIIDNDANASNYLDIDFIGLFITKSTSNDRTLRELDGSYIKQINFINCWFWQSTSEKLIENKADQSTIDERFINCVFESIEDPYTFINKEIVKFQNNDTKNSIKMINCTLFGGSIGVEGEASDYIILKNCAIFYTDGDDFGTTFNTNPEYCAFDDTGSYTFTNDVDISPGADENAEHERAFDGPLNTSGRSNVSIGKKSSVLYRAGKDRRTDSDIPAYDILGYPRPYGKVSIGAFEYKWNEYQETESKIMGQEYPTRPCGSNGFSKFMGVG